MGHTALPTPNIPELIRRLSIDANRLELLRARSSSQATLETIARAEASNACLRAECDQLARGIDMPTRRRLSARVGLQLRLTATLTGMINQEQRELA
ncbi:MAG TPA: hypothetical protein VFV98_00015 [Vicinamibacterales bacterium]|nr:hypothetical protein [Vicinamibacterales bacterium]